MGQIILQGLDPEIESIIRQIANEKRQSVKHVLTEIIRQTIEKDKHIPKAASLKKFAGTWTKKEAADFLKSIASCEQIDENMWQ